MCTFSSLTVLYWTILSVNHQHAYRYYRNVYLFIPQGPLLDHPACKPPTGLQVSQECVPFHPSASSIGQSCLYNTNNLTGITGLCIMENWAVLPADFLLTGVTGMCTHFRPQPSMLGPSFLYNVNMLTCRYSRNVYTFPPSAFSTGPPSWRPSTFLTGIQPLYRKSDLCVPRNKIAQPCSQFLH